HPALIGPQERSFSCGHRNIKDPVSMLAPYQKRAGEPERHLNRSDGVLNITPHLLAVNRVATNVKQSATCLFLDPLSPPVDIHSVVTLADHPGDELERTLLRNLVLDMRAFHQPFTSLVHTNALRRVAFSLEHLTERPDYDPSPAKIIEQQFPSNPIELIR